MHTPKTVRSALLVCLPLSLLSGSSLASTSMFAPSLAVLAQDSVLCYSAEVSVNDKPNVALSRQAQAIMLKTLNGLALSARQDNALDSCDRQLFFSFSVDNAGAPTIFNDELKLITFTATDGGVELKPAIIWTDGFWGGNIKVLSPAVYTATMQKDLVKLLSEFTADYRKLVK